MKSGDTRQITEGVIWKTLLSFFFPILMGSFFQQLYNTADTIIVGRAIGTQALAAVGSSSALINLINGFVIGLSSGASVVLAQFYGAGDSQGTAKALHASCLLCLVLGGITTLFGVGAGPGILRLIQTPETCIDDAVLYVQIYFSGSVATMVYNMGSGLLRAMGDSLRPTVFLILTCLINVALDLLFVSCWNLGIAGAAWATVISQCISALLIARCLLHIPGGGRSQWKQYRPDPNLLKHILAIGIPAGLQFITYDLSNIITQSSINSFGDITTAAWTAYAKTDAVIWMVLAAFGVAITTFVGQNYGACQYDRIRKSTGICFTMSAGAVIIMSTLEVLFREPILGIYTTDPEVIRVGAYMMQFAVPYIFLFVPVEILGGAMRGCGYSLVPTLITGAFACAFRICWVFIVVRRWHSLLVLIICYPISWLLCATVFLGVWFRGSWLTEGGNYSLKKSKIL